MNTQGQRSNLECSQVYRHAEDLHNELIRESENCRTNKSAPGCDFCSTSNLPLLSTWHYCCCSSVKLQVAASSHSGHKWLVIVWKMASEITTATPLQVEFSPLNTSWVTACFLWMGEALPAAAHQFPVTPRVDLWSDASYTHQASFINLAL